MTLGNMCIDYDPERFDGNIVCDSRLGGVIKHYYRE